YCALYPCHLHINVAADYRNHGVGTALIEAFATQASNTQAPGMHIVTNEGARNISFYERNNFRILSATYSGGARVVFMGRQLRQNRSALVTVQGTNDGNSFCRD